jgi:hypothetical protein
MPGGAHDLAQQIDVGQCVYCHFEQPISSSDQIQLAFFRFTLKTDPRSAEGFCQSHRGVVFVQVVFIYFQDKDVLFPQALEMADIGAIDTVAFLESPAFELVFADFRYVMTQNQPDRVLDFDGFVHASILLIFSYHRGSEGAETRFLF